jgi:hypothetical protein
LEIFFENVHVPSINPEVADQLEEDLSTEEIKLAIRSMQGGKSLGPDGFPTDFLK